MDKRVDKERVKSIILGDLRRAKAFYEETVEPKLIERREVYLASKKFYERKFPWLSLKSDYRSYDFYALVQWASSLIIDSFFGDSRIVSVQGISREDDKAAKVMNKLIDYQLEHQGSTYKVYKQWIEDGLVYEFGIVKLWWERQTETKEYKDTISLGKLGEMQQAGVKFIEISEADYFGNVDVRYVVKNITGNKPVTDIVSPFDMRWSPEARSLKTANFVAQRQFVSASELKRGIAERGYDAVAVEEAISKEGAITQSEADQLINPELGKIGTEEDRSRALVEVYECYANIDVNEDGILEKVIVTVANDEVIRIAKNSFERLPFFQLAVHWDSRKVFCDEIAYADVEGEIQHTNTAITRQLLTNLALSNNGRKFIDSTVVNMDDMLSDRVFIRCNGAPTTAVMPEPTTQISSWTLQFVEALKAKEEEWTGRTRYNQGMSSESLNKTATGIQTIMQASAQRINSIIRIFADGFKDLMSFQVMLNQKYMNQETVIRLFNEPLTIAPDDIRGNLDIVVDADVGLGKKQRTIQALTMYLQQGFNFAMQLGITNKMYFLKAITLLLELSGLKNADGYFMTEQEIQQQEQQQQQMQQLQLQIQQAMQQQQAAQTQQQGVIPNDGSGTGAV